MTHSYAIFHFSFIGSNSWHFIDILFPDYIIYMSFFLNTDCYQIVLFINQVSFYFIRSSFCHWYCSFGCCYLKFFSYSCDETLIVIKWLPCKKGTSFSLSFVSLNMRLLFMYLRMRAVKIKNKKAGIGRESEVVGRRKRMNTFVKILIFSPAFSHNWTVGVLKEGLWCLRYNHFLRSISTFFSLYFIN